MPSSAQSWAGLFPTADPIVLSSEPSVCRIMTIDEESCADQGAGIFTPDKRQARVAVVNNTLEPIVAVSVLHKYSDVYNDRHEWPVIGPGKSSEGTMTVNYNTGWSTTGKDWWLIVWYSKDLKTRWYSNANNYRAIFDKLEEISPAAIRYAATGLAALLTSGTGPGAVMAGAAANRLASSTTDRLFNSESTDGFKQHMLRVEDAGKLTEIVINRDKTITFKSRSGMSETVTMEDAVKK